MERNVWRKGNGKGLYNGKKKSQNKGGQMEDRGWRKSNGKVGNN